MASNSSRIVAVTGANGFVASHIVDALLRRGFSVRACVRDPSSEAKTAHLRRLADEQKAGTRLSFVRGDLGEEGSYDDAFRGAEFVVHAAARVAFSGGDPQKDIVDPSVEGTKNVLASADRSGTVRRFVHTSSVAAVVNFGRPTGTRFTEEDYNTWSTVDNGDAYGFAKYSSEVLVREHCAAAGAKYDCAFVNPSFVIGPCLAKAHTKASPVILRQVIFGNKQPQMHCTFVDVRDVADVHVEAMIRPEASGRRFLAVNDDAPVWVSDLAPKMKAAVADRQDGFQPASPTFSSIAVWFYRVIGRVTEAEAMMTQKEVFYSNARAKRELGIRFRPVDESIRDTVASMVDNGFIKLGKK